MAAALIKQVYIARLEMDIYFETTAKGVRMGTGIRMHRLTY